VSSLNSFPESEKNMGILCGVIYVLSFFDVPRLHHCQQLTEPKAQEQKSKEMSL
jgi:hypothetical protein